MPRGTKVEKRSSDIELRPDGWERFERAIGAAVKSGPKHRAVAIRSKQKRPKPKTNRV
jgi:hypothetical protein